MQIDNWLKLPYPDRIKLDVGVGEGHLLDLPQMSNTYNKSVNKSYFKSLENSRKDENLFLLPFDLLSAFRGFFFSTLSTLSSLFFMLSLFLKKLLFLLQKR